jgi:predicted 3-demethylubiquinone-9 3-methyltransferase (glyoxalase superfamily)
MSMQKITPFLWFDGRAEEAVKFYISIFKKSKIVTTSHYDEGTAKATGRPKGSVMTMVFKLEGQDFMALNGGPHFKFTEAISFVVNCKTQKELDYYWRKLSAGGQEVQCGWLKDKFGVSWQIVPSDLGKLLGSRDPKKTERVMNAVMQMTKLDIKTLRKAYSQK